jgi:hypothetical protein
MAGVFMRGRMAGMKLRLPITCLLAQIGDASDSESDYPSFWWVVFATLVIMALCWFILSVMNKGKASLWKDDDSEMDSSSDPASMG